MIDSPPTFAIAFVAGLASFFTPCIVVLIPVFLSSLAGVSVELVRSQNPAAYRGRVLAATVAFIVGFTVIFTALGVLAGLFARQLAAAQDTINLVGGAVVVLFGLIVAGVLQIPMLQRTFRIQTPTQPVGPTQSTSLVGSFLVGVTFAFGWTPCVGPILGAILVLAAGGGSIGSATLLLLAYSIGLMVPFLLAALFLRQSFAWIRKLAPLLPTLEKIAGLLLVLLGILLATGRLPELMGRLYGLLNLGI